MSKKVIVTGVTGQTGSYMVEYLLEKTDYVVVAAIRRTSRLIDENLKTFINNPRVKIAYFDLLDPISIENLVKQERPDYFLNFGAQTFVADSWDMPVLHFQTNAMAALYILESIRKHAPKCRLYLAGSSEEWGNVDYTPQDINHRPKPRSPYGASKCASRLLAKVYRESYGLYVLQGILLNHESERRQKYFITRKISCGVADIYHDLKNLQKVLPIELGNLDAKRDWSHAMDFVDGVWRMMNQETYNKNWNGAVKEYVLSSNETHSVREFVEKSFKVVGIEGYWKMNGLNAEDECFMHLTLDIPLVKVNPKFYRPAEVELLLGDSTLARTELEWTPKISFDDLVRIMVMHDVKNHK